MDESSTATIIPFPSRRPATGEIGQSTERLSTALSSLSKALMEQRAALHRWRDSLAELQARMQTIAGTHGERAAD